MQRAQALRRLTPAISALNHQRESAIAPGLFALSLARRPFPQTVNSPQHKIARSLLPVVNYTTTERAVYFAFLNSAKARDAYAYFLYHQQLGPCDTTLILHAPREAILTT